MMGEGGVSGGEAKVYGPAMRAATRNATTKRGSKCGGIREWEAEGTTKYR
jgi:hypothetical protein